MLLLYKQAAKIVEQVINGEGSPKYLCLLPEVQKKKATYALVMETLKHLTLVDKMINNSGIMTDNENLWLSMVRVLVYDMMLGKGFKTTATKQGLCLLIRGYREKFKKSMSKVKKEIEPLPRYARVNLFKISFEDCVKELELRGFNYIRDGQFSLFQQQEKIRQKQEREMRKKRKAESKQGDEKKPEAPQEMDSVDKLLTTTKQSKGVFFKDPIVPNLLVFQHNAPLYTLALVKNSSLILQDRSSCLAANVATGEVSLDSNMEENLKKLSKGTVFHTIIDACAAPGNKTSILANAFRNSKVIAIDWTKDRCATMKERMKQFGIHNVDCVCEDFLNIDPTDAKYNKAELILLDPSCTGSGITQRIDVDEKYQNYNKRYKYVPEKEDAEGPEPEEGDAPEGGSKVNAKQERAARLAAIQKQLLAHALKFPNVKRVVYSTCSIYNEENEEVVRDVMQDETVSDAWHLVNIMNGDWNTRGKPVFEGAQNCIRCSKLCDHTNGFFIACLEKKAYSTFQEQPEEGMDSLVKQMYGKTIKEMQLQNRKRPHSFEDEDRPSKKQKKGEEGEEGADAASKKKAKPKHGGTKKNNKKNNKRFGLKVARGKGKGAKK